MTKYQLSQFRNSKTTENLANKKNYHTIVNQQ
jgi:hypothetical protein